MWWCYPLWHAATCFKFWKVDTIPLGMMNQKVERDCPDLLRKLGNTPLIPMLCLLLTFVITNFQRATLSEVYFVENVDQQSKHCCLDIPIKFYIFRELQNKVNNVKKRVPSFVSEWCFSSAHVVAGVVGILLGMLMIFAPVVSAYATSQLVIFQFASAFADVKIW